MSHFTKGSPEAKAWGARMQARRRHNPGKRGKGIKVYYAGVFIDGKQERSDGFRTSKEARAWIQGLKDEGSNVQLPGVYSETIQRPTVRRRTRSRRNPGEAYHVREAGEAHKVVRRTDDPDEKVFYAGVESAHRISASSAKRLGMNRPRERKIPAPRRRTKRNPLAVFGVGNPRQNGASHRVGGTITARIEGIVYNVCHEIKAEKTVYKPGLYRHPFETRASVKVFALDNGDMLIHSSRGINLWGPI